MAFFAFAHSERAIYISIALTAQSNAFTSALFTFFIFFEKPNIFICIIKLILKLLLQ
jgi:hypothetical protein